MDTLPMGYAELLKNIDYSFNEAKDMLLENFLESFKRMLNQLVSDFYISYGDVEEELSVLVPQFEDIEGATYRFMIAIKNSSEQEARLADIYNITNLAYDRILNMKGHYRNIPNHEPESYLDAIDSRIHFCSNGYVVVLDLIQPLITLILDKFMPGKSEEIINEIKRIKLNCGLNNGEVNEK